MNTNNKDKDVEKQIEEFINTLKNYEDTDPSFMGEEMKTLRHFVFFTHTVMEEALGGLIIRNMLAPIIPSDKKFTPELRQMYSVGTATMVETDFYRKVNLAYTADQIDGQTKDLIEKVNRLRNIFSHPNKFYDELHELKDNKSKYKDALSVLALAHKSMNDIFVKLLPNKLVNNINDLK